MNLSSCLRALAFASLCALPLSAGTLTFTLAESGANQITATAIGSLSDSLSWSSIPPSTPVRSAIIADIYGNFGITLYSAVGSIDKYRFYPNPSPSSFGSRVGMHYSSGQNLATSTVAFGYSVSGAFEISVPQGYTFGTPLISTEVFSGPFANFAWLGLIPGTARSYINGNDTITVNVVGGASSVPDNGIPTALVGSAVAGLCALRGRRAGRRIV